jgi:hypothetical protein
VAPLVAVANDVSALYWNPAGISRIARPEAVFERIEWLADISFNFFGAVIPFGRYGTAGVFLNAMSVPKMTVRIYRFSQRNRRNVRRLQLRGWRIYSFALTDRFSIGVNGKYIEERIWHEKARSIAFDIGTFYQTNFS